MSPGSVGQNSREARRSRGIGQSIEARAGILAALGVVGLRRGEAGLGGDRQERGGAEFGFGAAADLVEAEMAVVAVEQRVLDSLCHQRAAGLLEADGELPLALVGRRSSEERCEIAEDRFVLQPLGAGGFHRVGEHGPVRLGGRRVGHVGAVDRHSGEQRRKAFAHREGAVVALHRVGPEKGEREVGEAKELACEVAVDDLVLRDAGERGDIVAGDLAVMLRENIEPLGVAEKRGHRGDEFVAGGADDRPAGQLLAGLEDLLHVDRHVDRPGKLVEIEGRVGEAVDMVDPQRVDLAVRAPART